MMEKPCVQVHKFPLRYRHGSFLQGRMDYNISITQLPFVCYHCHFVEHGNKYLQQPSYVQHSFSARSALVKLWSRTNAERVIIVRSTKQKSNIYT